MMRNFDIGVLPITAYGKLVSVMTDRDIVARGVAESRDMNQVRAPNS